MTALAAAWLREHVGWIEFGAYGRGSVWLRVRNWRIIERYRTSDGRARWTFRPVYSVPPEVDR